MSSRATRRKRSRSASSSTIVTDTSRGYHVLKIDGYSGSRSTIPTGKYQQSHPFTIGGHRWLIRYYPNGHTSETADYISLFLCLAGRVTKPVAAHCKFRFRCNAADDERSLIMDKEVDSLQIDGGWGFPKFIKREEFEKSKYLQGNSFAVQCDVAVINEVRVEDTKPTFVSVSPSDLHHHLSDLLASGKGADVVFNVGGQMFSAHRCVLATRSPVFNAELYGTMKESDTGCAVRIEDMEAGVFKALLQFIYTDVFPEAKKEDGEGEEEDVMAQHLLVAADRYNLERLKQICEEKLCKYIDVGTVASILALADRHHCPGLKKACFHFLRSPENLKAAMANNGFEDLSKSCPSVMTELVTMLGDLVQS